MGFRNPFRLTLDKNDVAYVSDYSPDSNTPAQFRGPAGTGRFEIVRKPANYGWPLCYKTDLAVLQVGLQHVARRCRAPRRPSPTSATTRPAGRRTPRAGSRTADRRSTRASSTGLRSRTRRSGTRTTTTSAANPLGTPCFGNYGPSALTDPDAPGSTTPCPQPLPGALHRRCRPARHGAVRLRPGEPEPDEVPALLGRGVDRGRVHAGHAARGPDGLEQQDPQDQRTRCPAARCRRRRPGRGSATTRWTWSSVPTGRSTCSPTATASSPSTPTPA